MKELHSYNFIEEIPVISTILREKDSKKIKKKIITIPPCPDPKQPLRVGSYANSQKLEKVKAFELVNGECNIIWEPVKFQEQYIPEVSTIISTAVIGFVAASSPIILNAIKPIIKN